jgi:AraC-like DNA-binding protein
VARQRLLAPEAAFTGVPFELGDREVSVFEETRWREARPAGRCGGSDIMVSRWKAATGAQRREAAVTPDWCHIVMVALRPAKLTFSVDSTLLCDGSMAAGTIHISGPGQRLAANFVPPFDFLHLQIDNAFLEEAGLICEDTGTVEPRLFRDTLVEALSRSLVDDAGPHSRPHYVGSITKAIVMRAMARRQNERRCGALPKWRLKKLEQYLSANIERPISLGDMAAVAGLSKMHFAAQFRVATGFRPHEYLLLKRIEQAKLAMLETTMPLVEVAFSVGFNAQAHFSTVFKRFTGKSPARWKQEYQTAK